MVMILDLTFSIQHLNHRSLQKRDHRKSMGRDRVLQMRSRRYSTNKASDPETFRDLDKVTLIRAIDSIRQHNLNSLILDINLDTNLDNGILTVVVTEIEEDQ